MGKNLSIIKAVIFSARYKENQNDLGKQSKVP